ncbi:MAG: AAA family ATPase [Candidatus Hydrothermarchaeales archaeon]
MNSLKTSSNPFKPGSGLYPPYFAGREKEISIFERKLESTVDGAPMHMAIIGGWGIGKTSLLNTLEKLAVQKNCLPASMIAYPEETTSFVSTLIRQISSEIKAERWLKSLKEIEFSLGVVKLTFSSPGEAQISLREFLENVWVKIKDKKRAILITIDDLDLVVDFKGTMLLLRNTSMELTKRGCKVMFVISGTQALFERMYQAHEPLIRFFEPAILDRLTSVESQDAIRKPLENVGMSYGMKVVKHIGEISQGHPYYIQEISNHVFEKAEEKFDDIAFQKGFAEAFSDISRDIFIKRAESGSPTEKKILRILASNKPLRFSEVLALSKLSKSTASSSLSRLKDKELISQKDKEYLIEDRLFAQFIREQIVD